MQLVKLIVSVGLAAALGITAFFEARSQLPAGEASPIQLPLLTTPLVLSLSKQELSEIVQGEASVSTRRALASLGKRRLIGEPLDTDALWLWSLSQKPPRALATLELASNLSRRNRIVQLELMRLKALQGDLKSSFQHLDYALTVSPAASPAVLSGIVRGLEEPELVRLLIPYQHRPWYPELLRQGILSDVPAEFVAQLLMQSSLNVDNLPSDILPSLMKKLVASDQYSVAEKVAVQVAGISPTVIRGLSIDSRSMVESLGPLSWGPVAEQGMYIQAFSSGVEIRVDPAARGTALARSTAYTSGKYTISSNIEASSKDVSLYWRMNCIVAGAEKLEWSQLIPVSNSKQPHRTSMVIPAGCLNQQWQVVLQEESAISMQWVKISDLEFFRE